MQPVTFRLLLPLTLGYRQQRDVPRVCRRHVEQCKCISLSTGQCRCIVECRNSCRRSAISSTTSNSRGRTRTQFQRQSAMLRSASGELALSLCSRRACATLVVSYSSGPYALCPIGCTNATTLLQRLQLTDYSSDIIRHVAPAGQLISLIQRLALRRRVHARVCRHHSQSSSARE